MVRVNSYFFSVRCWVVVSFLMGGLSALGQHLATPVPIFVTYMDQSSHAAVRSLAERGVALHWNSVSDISKSPFHAHGDHSWFTRYSADVWTDIDGGKLLGWKDASIHVDVKRHAEVSGSLYGQVTQGYSNIDADPRTYLYEAWVMQTAAGGRLEIQAGKIDANTRFATVGSAADFLNSSMGYSPTIMSFPTYPYPQAGVDVSMDTGRLLRLRAGEFRTGAGRMTLVEGAQRWTRSSKGAAGDVELGYWTLRQELTSADDKNLQGTDGFYLVAEQTVWTARSSGEASPGKSLRAFLQWGDGTARENRFASHIGAGAVLQGTLRGRGADSLGLAATRALSGASWDGRSPGSEVVAEVYYKLALRGDMALVTDAQYFARPGGLGGETPFFVLTPRIVISF